MKYICNNCGYVYNNDIEEKDLEYLDKDWICPICFMPKDIFTFYNDEDDYLDLI